MKSRFERAVWVILAGLAAVGVGLFLYSQMVGIRPPVLLRAGQAQSGRGPFGLQFDSRMQEKSVQDRLQFSPALKIRQEWQAATLWLWPEEPLAAGSSLVVTLQGGAENTQGGIIRQAASWTIAVRAAALVYISPAGANGELWKTDLDGSPPTRLNLAGQKVADLGVSFDGQGLAYSVLNEQKGYDLWLVDRSGSGQRRLVDCAADWCLEPAWSADGRRIAYSRQVVDSTGRPLGSARLWTAAVDSGQTAPLYTDGRISGTGPAWSPDGSWLAFTDSYSGGIRVVDLHSSADFVMKARHGIVGGWSLDGKTLYFGDLDSGTLPSYGRAYAVNPADEQAVALFGHGPQSADQGVPVPGPDGQWIASGLRYIGGSPARQVILLSPDGSRQQAVGADELANQALYSWSPDGRQLTFQQLALGSSQAKPEVWVWELANSASRKIGADAAHPAWLP